MPTSATLVCGLLEKRSSLFDFYICLCLAHHKLHLLDMLDRGLSRCFARGCWVCVCVCEMVVVWCSIPAVYGYDFGYINLVRNRNGVCVCVWDLCVSGKRLSRQKQFRENRESKWLRLYKKRVLREWQFSWIEKVRSHSDVFWTVFRYIFLYKFKIIHKKNYILHAIL